MTGMNEGRFSEVRDEFVILKLRLDSYSGTARNLPPGYRLGPPRLDAAQKRSEGELLKANFPGSWTNVFEARLPGWSPQTPVYVFKGEELVGGLYLCAVHEFEEGSDWGQLHYFFVADAEKGKGLHSVLVAESIRRARSMGLLGIYINTDRHGLPEVYQRWGAQLWKTIPKANAPDGPSRHQGWNWLVLGIHDAALWEAIRRYARGDLADVGCGDKPYSALTRGIVSRHIGIDHSETLHRGAQIDIVASAYDTTLPDASVDTVLCTTVLEHLERPVDALREFRRILRPGGFAILSAPLFWHLHEEPRDFFRYTQFGLRYLLEQAGFSVVSVKPLSGFMVTFAQEACYYLNAVSHRIPAPAVRLAQQLLQRAAHAAHVRGWDGTTRFTWCYLAVARKPTATAMALNAERSG
jgi:SAM-dependent methyltransferase